jgi:hypothetical protein
VVEMNEKQCSDEHTQASTGSNKQLQPEVPSSSGRMGEATTEFTHVREPPYVTNNEWINNLIYRNSKSLSSGETTT